jgi:hypothetical protein
MTINIYRKGVIQKYLKHISPFGFWTTSQRAKMKFIREYAYPFRSISRIENEFFRRLKIAKGKLQRFLMRNDGAAWTMLADEERNDIPVFD